MLPRRKHIACLEDTHMEITRRTDYAIRLLLELARSNEGPVSVRELAERQSVPYAFARTVQRDLVAAGFITTVRGAKGGAVLAVDPHDVTLLQIVSAMQGVPSVAVCASDPTWCALSGGCAVHRVWAGADAVLHEYLGNMTLAGLTTDDGK